MPLLNLQGCKDGRIEIIIGDICDQEHFYKFRYFNNGDILYRADTSLEIQQHKLLKGGLKIFGINDLKQL